MKVEVIGRMPRVRGVRHEIGAIIDIDRKFVRAFTAAGMVREYKPPRSDIPASPSAPLSVVTEPSSDAIAQDSTESDGQAAAIVAPTDDPTQDGTPKDEESTEEPAPTASPRRRYSRRDMRSE